MEDLASLFTNIDVMFPFSPSSVSEDADTSTSKGIAEQKLCLVCGDRAIGYNFGIMACESCKSFFRRQALRAEEIRCPFNDNCAINVKSRRYCQACRLRKCIEMGMSVELLKKTEREKAPRKRTKMRKSIQDVLEGDSDEEVSVRKDVLVDLIRKASKKQDHCTCTCKCGFYPADTRLTELTSSEGNASNNTRCSPLTSSAQQNSPIPPPPIPSVQEINRFLPSAYPPYTGFDWYLNTATAGRIPASFDWAWPNLSLPPAPQSLRAPSLSTPSQAMPDGAQVSNPSSSAHSSIYNTSQSSLSVPALSTFSTPTSAISAGSSMTYGQQTREECSSTSTSRTIITALSSPAQLSPADQSKYGTLSAVHLSLLMELQRANEYLKAPLEIALGKEELSLLEVVNITNLALRRIIMMAKELESFKKLSNRDQLNLIKELAIPYYISGGASELLILRGVMVFDPTKNAWNHQANKGFEEMQVKLEILLSSPESQHYEEHKRFLTSFNDRVRKNDHIMLILSAIVLFSPDRPQLEDRKSVAITNENYKQLLAKILYCAFPTDYSEMLCCLLQRVNELKHLNRGFLGIYGGLDPTQLDPLLRELFDLDHTN